MTEKITREELIKNMKLLHSKLFNMIQKPAGSQDLNDVELEISELMYEIQYFVVLIQLTYPLENLYHTLLENPLNHQSENFIDNFVKKLDYNMRRSFLTLTQFTLETMLKIIAKKHSIEIDGSPSLTKKYLKVMDYFEIEHQEYESVLAVYHYVRNTQHWGTQITKDFGPYHYKGYKFEAKKGQEYIKFADWKHFTWFTSEVLEIYEKIIKSKKWKDYEESERNS